MPCRRFAIAVAMIGAIAPLAGLGVVPALAAERAGAIESADFRHASAAFRDRLNSLAASRDRVSAEEFKSAAAELRPALSDLEPHLRNAADRLTYGDWQRQLGNWLQDSALLARGLAAMLDSGQLQPNLVPTVSAMLGHTAYIAHDHATAWRMLGPLVAQGAIDDATPAMAAESAAAVGDAGAALATLDKAIGLRAGKGSPAPEDWYLRAMRIAHDAHRDADAARWATNHVRAYPSARAWLGAVQLVRATFASPDIDTRKDFAMLLDRAGALALQPAAVGDEYRAYLRAIDPRRFPGEAVRVADQAVTTGALAADDAAVTDAIAEARPRLAAARASLDAMVRDAIATPTGEAAMVAGDALLAGQDNARAAEMYTIALTRSVPDGMADHVLIRIAIAEIAQGQYAAAEANLAKVSAQRAALASLWTIYADQQAAAAVR